MQIGKWWLLQEDGTLLLNTVKTNFTGISTAAWLEVLGLQGIRKVRCKMDQGWLKYLLEGTQRQVHSFWTQQTGPAMAIQVLHLLHFGAQRAIYRLAVQSLERSMLNCCNPQEEEGWSQRLKFVSVQYLDYIVHRWEHCL